MFLLELRFFVFHSPRIKPEKKDRVFGSVGSQGQVKVSCFMLCCSLSKPETTFGMALFAPIMTCDLISCKVDKSTRFLCLRRSVYSVYLVYFWGFCPFQIFIVPIHRPLPKKMSESTCDKSRQCRSLCGKCPRPK